MYKIIKQPPKIVLWANWKGYMNWLPDKIYLNIMYISRMKKKLDLKHPKSFNEKLQWLKIYDRHPKYIQMVDKYEAKQYVAKIIGSEYIIPTYGVWNSFDNIKIEML